MAEEAQPSLQIQRPPPPSEELPFPPAESAWSYHFPTLSLWISLVCLLGGCTPTGGPEATAGFGCLSVPPTSWSTGAWGASPVHALSPALGIAQAVLSASSLLPLLGWVGALRVL